MNKVVMRPDRLDGGRPAAAAGRHFEDVAVPTVGVKIAGNNAIGSFVFRIFKQNGAGAVAEQHTGVAVGPVGDARQLFRAADEDVPILFGCVFMSE